MGGAVQKLVCIVPVCWYNVCMSEEIKLESNTDIDQALKEFEAKSVTEETQNASKVLKISDAPKMVGWVMKLSGGIIKEQKTAEYILLGFAIVAISISLFLFFAGGGTDIPKAALENYEYGLPQID